MSTTVVQSGIETAEGILRAIGIDQRSAGLKHRYAIISGKTGARWFLPNAPKLTATVLREWEPYRPVARLAWKGLRCLARCGLLLQLPGVRTVDFPGDVSEQLLQVIGSDLSLALPLILVGNPESSNKVIIFLPDDRGRVRAVAKVPLTSTGRMEVKSEAEMLTFLDGTGAAPKLIRFSAEKDILVQSYISGKPGHRTCRPEYIQLLLSLTQTGRRASLKGRSESCIASLARQNQLGTGPESLLKLIGLLATAAEDYPVVTVHGDFAPWNIRELPDRSCALVDWEKGQVDGIPLYDLCHFLYVQAEEFRPESSFYSHLSQSESFSSYCAAMGLSPSLATKLIALYLLTVLAEAWAGNRAASAAFCLYQIDRFVASVSHHNPARLW